jgi:hypothetical protein
MKLRAADKITLLLLGAGFCFLFFWYAATALLPIHFDQPSILVIWAVSMLAVILIRIIWGLSAVMIPAGLAGVVYRNKLAISAVEGPTTLHFFPLLDQVSYVELLQPPLDLSMVCTTQERVQVTLALSVYYKISINYLVAHLNKWIDIQGDIKRHTCAEMLQQFAACELNNVPIFASGVVRKLTTHFRSTVNSRDYFEIDKILVIAIRYPIEVMRSAEALVRARYELQIADAKAKARLSELTPETDARVDELQKIDDKLKTVSKDTLEYVATHTMLDHWVTKPGPLSG